MSAKPASVKPAPDPIADLLKSADKKYNLTVGPMNAIAVATTFITTGNLALDHCIGGGIPLGRSTELFGPPSSGKSTVGLQTAARLQDVIKAGGDEARGIGPDDHILYLDYEQAMDKVYAKALGLDVDHRSFLFTQPDTLEDGCNFTLAALRTGRIRMVIFDSVAAMNPSAKADDSFLIGKSLPALQAKLMKDFGVTLNAVIAHHNAAVIFLNHQMEKMSMGGPSRPGMPPATTTPGGVATKFFASVRVEFKQIRQNKGSVIDPLSNDVVQAVTSTDVRIKVVKNKVAPPFREAVVRVRFGQGFDNFWTALQVLLANKKIIHSSGMFYFHNLEAEGFAPPWMRRATAGTKRPYIKGEENVFAAGDADPDWRSGLVAYAASVVADNVEILSQVAPLRAAGPDDDEDESVALDDLLDTAASATGHRAEI